MKNSQFSGQVDQIEVLRTKYESSTDFEIETNTVLMVFFQFYKDDRIRYKFTRGVEKPSPENT